VLLKIIERMGARSYSLGLIQSFLNDRKQTFEIVSVNENGEAK